MTNEQARKILVNATFSNEWQGNEDLTTAYHMAIKALEQEPSEDCVSREQAIVQLSIDLSEIELPRIKDSLDKLPPVTTTRKIGKWEHDKLFGECAYVCSFCHTIWTSSEIENMHYCPTCGAEMVGAENE